MNDDQKFKEAKNLIDTFAEQLLALSGGRKIPLRWKNSLIKAIQPLPGKPGRKIDYEKNSEIVKYIILDLDNINAERTKNHNPTEYKDKIAKKFGISRKKVDRIRVAITKTLSGQGFLDPEMREANMDGICRAISADLSAAAKKDQEVQLQRARNISKFPSPK